MSESQHQIALRIEWCKARARAHRWQEECLLIAEEMRRVVEFFKWQEAWWRSLSQSLSGVPSDDRMLSEGKVAYALRQAALRAQLCDHFKVQWSEFPPKLTTMEGRDAYQMIECH